MIKECMDIGRTVDEAIERACEKLGIPREEVEFDIIDLPRKGFLGFGGNPAKVRVYKEFPDEKPVTPAAPPERPAVKPAPAAPAPTPPAPATPAAPATPVTPATPKAPVDLATAALTEAKAQAAAAYLKTVLDAMGLTQVTITVKQNGENAILALAGEGLGMIIGRRGETMDALQYLVSLAANRVEGSYTRITLDSGNYREKRERTLDALAKKLASTAVRTGRSSTLEPMNPYERRIIHSAVAMVEGAASSSIGEEPNRRVVISAANGGRTGATRPPFVRDDRRGPRGPRRDGESRDGQRPPRTPAPVGNPSPGTVSSGTIPPETTPRESLPQGNIPREEPVTPTPVSPAENTSQRSAPKEAADTPLYGKIEL